MSDVKWTVSIIIQFYSDEIDYGNELIKKAILNQSNHDSVKYYIFEYDILAGMANILTVNFTNGKAILSPDKKNIQCDDLYDNPEKYWKPFFDEYAVLQKAKHNFLITCGHGAGFGFVTRDKLPEDFGFTQKDQKKYFFLKQIFSTGILGFDKEKIFNLLLLSFNDFQIRLNRFKKRLLSKNLFRIIPLEILNSVLAKSFVNPIEFWYARNCYMQMFESGYALKSQVRYLAGSENFVLSAGIDYEKLFNELGNNLYGEDHLRSIAENICSNLPIKYQDESFLRLLKRKMPKFSRTSIKFISLSGNNLQQYLRVQNSVDKMAAYFLNNKEFYPLIKQVRQDCKDVSPNPYGIIDLINFCKRLIIKTNNNTILKEILEELVTLITVKSETTVIVANYFPPDSYTNAGLAVFPYGMSIFFPEDKKVTENDQYIDFFMTNFYKQKNIFENDFRKNSAWTSFVIDYYDHPF